MKKLLKTFIVIGLIIAVLFVAGLFLRVRVPHMARAAELVPAEAIVFAQFPDLPRTGERWKSTALSQLWNEPEMQAFLEKPRAKIAKEQSLLPQLARLQNVGVGEAFFAVTSIDGTEPRFVAGFSFSGSRSEVEALLAEPRAALKKARPTGRAELVNYGAAEIETFTEKEATVAGVFRDNWYFLANNLELLEQTLDRYDHKNDSAAGSLAKAAIFLEATAPLPADRDALIVAQLGTVMDRVTALLLASGQKMDEKQVADLKKTTAIAAATKLDGTQFRDTIFVLSPGGKTEAPLARNSLALTSPATLLYFALALPAAIEVPDSAAAMLPMILPNLAPMQKSLAAKGLSFAEWNQAFGPEFGAVMDWPPATLQPSLMLTLDVRDAAKARAFADALTGPVAGGPAWLRKEENGATIYSAPPADGLQLVTPTFALTEKFLVAGLSAEAVGPVGARLKSEGANLSGAPAFESAGKTVGAPTSAYGFIDLRGLFERAYGTFRPFIIMSLAFAPDAGEWIDGAKLPTTETFTKHLGPIVMSQSTSERGTLLESRGTLTINQVLVAAVGAAIRAALPNLQNLQGIGLDPGKFLQPGIPPAALPPAFENEEEIVPALPIPPIPVPPAQSDSMRKIP